MNLVRRMDISFRPVEEIRELQRVRLLAQARHCKARSPFYRERLRRIGLPRSLSLEELLDRLPLTAKADLEARNEDFLAVPPGAVVDIVTSSGTTGRPTRIEYTEHDLRRLAYNEEKSFRACGLGPQDRVLLTCTLDRGFIAGLAYFLGLRSLGAAAIRNGHDTMEGHWRTLRRLAPTALVGVPSFLRKLGRHAEGRGTRPAELNIRCLVAIGEPVRRPDLRLLPVGADLEALWGARVYSTYASTETVSTFCECTAQRGGHLHPDLAVVEILDEGGRRLPAGRTGEVVITPLGVEGMPLLRFRTGDLGFLLDGPCPCGRNSVRLGPILGRRAQMLKVQGTTLYPGALLEVLSETKGIAEYYVSAESEDELSDRVTVHVAFEPGAGLPAEDLAERLRARLRVRPRVRIASEAELRAVIHSPESRKPVRFLDLRRPAAGADAR